MIHRLALIAVVCFAAVGCARKESFDVSVRNGTDGPLTLVLTKDGPPFERLWAAPEDLAIESPRAEEQHSYLVLPANRDADINLEGKFDRGTRGYLRVYRGDLPIPEMVAIGPASPNRLDLRLEPGANRFVIVDSGSRLIEKGDAAAEQASPYSP